MNQEAYDLAQVIYQSHRDNTQLHLQDTRWLKGSQWAWAQFAAQRLLAAGYRKQEP